jgi:hypothetical protein
LIGCFASLAGSVFDLVLILILIRVVLNSSSLALAACRSNTSKDTTSYWREVGG